MAFVVTPPQALLKLATDSYRNFIFNFARNCLRSLGELAPQIPYRSLCNAHSKHSVMCGHLLQTFFAVAAWNCSPFSGKNSSVSTSEHNGFSNLVGTRIGYLTQTASHLSVAPLGALHIQARQGPLAPSPVR